ncbi:hypothetical protein RG47T_4981 [Mucilaginibacter polytrichastri]|uniref:Uncharacterized protein n=1 Tax=Mucilaginibacter polytrichastri TaxID=1302689 RepID=A0A1Q6A661_9SPHI|nr:hypothetical protein RG47T_4981 [Mucilaginibacter polytrichastri]
MVEAQHFVPAEMKDRAFKNRYCVSTQYYVFALPVYTFR